MDKPSPNKATPPIISAQRPRRGPINRPARIPPVDITKVAAIGAVSVVPDPREMGAGGIKVNNINLICIC
jgi:hypothetical protein